MVPGGFALLRVSWPGTLNPFGHCLDEQSSRFVEGSHAKHALHHRFARGADRGRRLLHARFGAVPVRLPRAASAGRGRDQRRERSGGEELVWHGTPRRPVTIVRRGNGQKGSMFLVTKPSNARNRPEPLGIFSVWGAFWGTEKRY